MRSKTRAQIICKNLILNSFKVNSVSIAHPEIEKRFDIENCIPLVLRNLLTAKCFWILQQEIAVIEPITSFKLVRNSVYQKYRTCKSFDREYISYSIPCAITKGSLIKSVEESQKSFKLNNIGVIPNPFLESF